MERVSRIAGGGDGLQM